MTTLQFTVTVRIDGDAADDVADDLRIDADAGSLDLALLQLIRQHLAAHDDSRDWRIVSAVVTVEGSHHAAAD